MCIREPGSGLMGQLWAIQTGTLVSQGAVAITAWWWVPVNIGPTSPVTTHRIMSVNCKQTLVSQNIECTINVQYNNGEFFMFNCKQGYKYSISETNNLKHWKIFCQFFSRKLSIFSVTDRETILHIRFLQLVFCMDVQVSSELTGEYGVRLCF